MPHIFFLPGQLVKCGGTCFSQRRDPTKAAELGPAKLPGGLSHHGRSLIHLSDSPLRSLPKPLQPLLSAFTILFILLK